VIIITDHYFKNQSVLWDPPMHVDGPCSLTKILVSSSPLGILHNKKNKKKETKSLENLKEASAKWVSSFCILCQLACAHVSTEKNTTAVVSFLARTHLCGVTLLVCGGFTVTPPANASLAWNSSL